MLKNLNKHLHKHPILISLVTTLLIFILVALPLVTTKNVKDSGETNRFLQLVSGSSKLSSVSSQSLVSISSSSLLSSSSSSTVSSSSVSLIVKVEPEPKEVTEEVKPVFIQPIKPIPLDNIQPQNNIEKVVVAPLPKPIVKETPKPIIQPIIETPPAPKPAPVVEAPKPQIDNSFTATGCDQNLANQMLTIVNSHRATNGAKALSLSGQLGGIACAHSKWMTTSGIFSHTGRDSTNPFERCKKAGTYCYAENVAYNTIPSVQDLFEQFKNSPGHNLNMLDPNFVEIGIAFDGIYVTQVFR